MEFSAVLKAEECGFHCSHKRKLVVRGKHASQHGSLNTEIIRRAAHEKTGKMQFND